MSRLTSPGRAVGLLLLAAALACADDAPTSPQQPPPPPPATVAAVTLDAAAVQLEEGTAGRLRAAARDASGHVIPNAAIDWHSTNEAVVRVAADGSLTALRPGSARVIARSGTRQAEAAVTVAPGFAFDLLFDGWLVADGRAQPRLFRLDPRQADAPQPVLPPTHAPADVAPSPDGTRIAFVGSSHAGTDLFVANRDGSGVVQLTATPESEDQPAWSADGTAIAYRRWTHGTPARVWVVRADGTGARPLVADTPDAEQQRPAWSPTLPGGIVRIAFSRVTRASDGYLRAQLRTVRANGTGVHAVTAGAAFDDQPSWSPDGQTLAFVRTGGEHDGTLFLASAVGGHERPLLAPDPAGPQRAPAWSPDGRHLAFASAHDVDAAGYAWQIYTARADGSQLVRRTFDLVEKDNPAWLRR